MLIRKLEKTGALQILSHLHQNGEATRSDLRTNVNAAMETIYTALENLKSLGLIEETVSNSFPKTVKVHLSEKGIAVAKRVHEIQNILQGVE